MNEHTRNDRKTTTSILGEQRPYRVQFKAEIVVSVEVGARSEEEARAKAFSWTGDYPTGVSVVGHYYLGESASPVYDDGEMHWSVEGVSPQDFLEVVELEEDETDAIAADCEPHTDHDKDGEVILP